MTKATQPNEPGNLSDEPSLEPEKIADLELAADQVDDIRGGRCTQVKNGTIQTRNN